VGVGSKGQVQLSYPATAGGERDRSWRLVKKGGMSSIEVEKEREEERVR